LGEIEFDKKLRDVDFCQPALHTQYRSVLGQVNWLQSRTQYKSFLPFFNVCVSDVKQLYKLVRSISSEPYVLKYWPLKGKLRLIGYPAAAYRNNADNSSHRGQTIFLAEERTVSKYGLGSMIEFESHKINRVALSTTASELYSFTKCFGTCQFLRGLWVDISAACVAIHMRTDANNLVTTASTTRLPERKETTHLIQMLRKESCS
jgi:hypothetical protein